MDTTLRPKCGHCGYEIEEEDVWYPPESMGEIDTEDGGESWLKCPNPDCGRHYGVRCVHEIKFIKIDADGDEI